ncbi:MAG: flagellar biosynthesis protein FlhF [Thiobacillaceae bacterium]
MKVQRIFGKTAREALRRLKNEMGAEAIILSNRAVEGGVEIIAMPSADVAAISRQVEAEREETNPGLTSAAASNPVALAFKKSTPPPAPDPVMPPGPDFGSIDAAGLSVVDEIRRMRESLGAQIEEMTWGDLPRRDPLKTNLLKELLAAGFSPVLSKKLMEKLPSGTSNWEQAMNWVRSSLTKNLMTLPSEEGLLEQGGVFALMGPTGVGKTTTTAKLAARFVVRHGADKLALLTTDSYRIGGQEQLRIFGKILGVTVHAVRDGADLRLAISELRNKQTVLIDTIGMSQRDQGVAEQVAMFNDVGRPVKKLLLLNATSHGDTLNEVIHVYQGQGLDGCILTKIDESASLGNTLDCVIRNRLKVHYLATGQRVPEDLHLASGNYLVHRAFKLRSEVSPFGLQEADIPLAMSLVGSAHGREMAVAFA